MLNPPRDTLPDTALVAELESRQDEVLHELDALIVKLEAVLAQHAPAKAIYPATSAPVEKAA